MSLLICMHNYVFCFFFFFNATATTEIYTLSLHDALPICGLPLDRRCVAAPFVDVVFFGFGFLFIMLMCLHVRSEEHTSELQSRLHLVCRLLLEKKKQNN